MTGFILPDYHGNALANVLPSIEARLMGEGAVIDIPQASRYVVLLIDGLGWEPLSDHLEHAETLGRLLPDALRLTCSVPSTTAVSLTSLGCGVPPGRHGIVGYTFVDPDQDRVMNALSWEGGPEDVPGFCCCGTAFDRLAALGHLSGAVSLARFEGTALTQLGFRGTRHFGVEVEEDAEHLLSLLHQALATSEVVYCYDRKLDHDGHGFGVGSYQWRGQLERVDDLVAQISDSLPPDVCLLVTGDHGMVNVPDDRKIVAEDHPELGGYRHIAGEGRFRQLHTDDPVRLAAAWAEFLGDRAQVALRSDALAAQWFGPDVDPRVLPRIGDVLVAMRDDWGLMTRTFPGEFNLIGMHGSLTPAEMIVPLCMVGPR